MSLTRAKSVSLLNLLFLFISFASYAGGPIGADLNINFNSNTIGPGSNSQLTYTFTGVGPGIVTDIAVTNTFPAAVVLSSSANPVSDCNGAVVTAPNGGSIVTISDISLPMGSFCTVVVNVTSSTPGVHTNTTDNVTTSEGTSISATDDLTVVTDRPGFTKSFSPNTVGLGAPSTLTFTIDNTANTSNVTFIQFTDMMPSGMVVASPSAASTTCGGQTVTLTAISGSDQINFQSFGANFAGFESVVAGASCAITVDIIAGAVGQLINQSSDLNVRINGDFTDLNSGFAIDELNVNIQTVILSKDFVDDPIVPSGTGTLRFTILNTDRNNATSNMAFIDDLSAVLPGLVAIGLPQSNVCGAGSSLTGSGIINLSGGNLPPEGECSFDVTVQVPAAAGQYTNTTSNLTGDLNGSGFTSNPAVADLFVEPGPILTKQFTDDPVGAGGTVNLEFTVTNTSTTDMATNISFIDELTTFLPFPVAVTLPTNPNPPCGAGSAMSLSFINTDRQGLLLTGGSLAAGASCTFSVDIDIPNDLPNGIYTNTTENPTATVNGVTYNGKPATDDLVVVAAPQLSKEFTDDPVISGSNVTLEFTLTHDGFAPADASNITFTDDLNTTLAGLSASGLPLTDICGVGSSISGTTNLTFTGGLLAPGETCTFNVTLGVPANALSGQYPNITSTITADVLGVSANGNPASDVLNIANISFTKEFLDDPVIPGGNTLLRFTIDNSANTQDATGVFFTDNLNATLAGLSNTSGMATVNTCGGTLSGTTFLIYVGGSVTAGSSCTIEVELLVPPGSSTGDYTNISSSLNATIGGGTVILPPAIDDLMVSSDVLLFSKEFTDDPVAPGSNVTLEFIIENIDPNNTVSNIGFTDDLDATLTGLVLDTPISNTCGGMGSGTSVFTYAGGSLAPMSSCTIQLSLIVPAGATSSVNTNITNQITGTAGGLPVNGNVAMDDLLVNLVTFSKSFDGPTTATGTPVLTYTITNLDASNPVADLQFNDDLDAVVSGLVATGLPVSNTCGVGSTVAGTSFLTFSGGNLPASGFCEFMVNLVVPNNATAGTYPSTSSDLTVSGLLVSIPATADLVIEPAPTFAKSFAPGSIGLNQNSTLSFSIDNTASLLSATGLDMTDNLPAGMIVASPSITTNTCGGTLTATAGTGVISLTNGSVAVMGSCNLQVDVIGTAVGMLVNTTGDLTSSSGNSGTANDTLLVNPQPGFSKSFAPDPVFIGGISILTFNIDNSASTVVTTALNFTDTLPAGLAVSTPSNATTTCTGGILTAVPASTMITYASGSVNNAVSCTVSVDVVAVSAGNLMNVSGDLTSSLGNSGNATDTIVVNPPPTFVKVFNPDVIIPNGVSNLTFTIDNTVSTVNATGIDFTDNLPVDLSVATPSNIANTCTDGTLTAVSGTTVISYSGGTLNSGVTCLISVDVTSSTVGNHMNLTGDLTSNHGNSGPAMANLLVTNTPVFSKAFTNINDVINNPNTLTFSINNSANNNAIGGLGFTDNMPAGFTVANPANITNTCTGGTITAASSSTSIIYSGGSVAANLTCTISVDVIASMTGQFTNTTSVLLTELGNGNVATADITISSVPLFAKSFVPNIIAPGGVSTLSFVIDNTANVIDTNNFAFVDNFPAGLTVAPVANIANTCVSATITAVTGSGSITVSNGTVAANSTCQISVDVTSTTSGFYTNVTGDLTSDAGNSGTATADLNVTGGLTFNKTYASFVTPGGNVTLSFLIENTTNTDADNISFSDNLGAVISANAINLPLDNICGVGSQMTGSPGGLIQFTNGSLVSGDSCQIDVVVQIDPSVLPGVYTNTTSPLTAEFNSNVIVTGPASDDFTVVAAPVINKSFQGGTITAGDTIELTFSITNNAPVEATQISFSDDLNAFIAGSTGVNLPQNDVCGVGSSISGTSTLLFQNGTLAANSSCQFSVFITIPMNTSTSQYVNVTSASSANYSGLNVVGGNQSIGSATLIVNGFVYQVPLFDNWISISLLLILMLIVANVYYYRIKKSL